MASPAMVTGDIVAGAAVLASISGYMHDTLSNVVLIMAAIYYLAQFGRWVCRRFFDGRCD